MTRDGGVRVGAVASVAAVSTALCWLLLAVWRNTGHELPLIPWVGLVPLVLVAVTVLAAGWQVRRYARAGDLATAGRRRVPPQRARGTLVAAQSCALGGGALLGWYVANAGLHLPNADVSSVRSLLIRAAASAGAALLVAVVGLIAQAWCRLPPGKDDEQDPPARGVSYAAE